jgi:hypothetical protein
MDETWAYTHGSKCCVIVPRDWKEVPCLDDDEKQAHVTLVIGVAADGFSLPLTIILPHLHNFPPDLRPFEHGAVFTATNKG